MFRSVVIRGILVVSFSMAVACLGLAAQAPSQSNQDKHVDIQSSAGDLHVGNDADARKAGLPLYPGARLRHDDENSNAANLSLFTDAFGVKLVLAKYDSDDAPGKVIDFYRDKLKKYGKVIECHTREHGGAHADFNDDEDSRDKRSSEVKCEGDNTGPVTELKVGTENNQHVVAIEPSPGGGSTFALVYVHTRGKQGDI
ncbi:MAG TPA: hypothetical protein VGZ91_01840 [Candidatus Sulfotelmatobacter sp.]|nr:hypothetical protein [Candidatus Sulfotelmatobacter sp.]